VATSPRPPAQLPPPPRPRLGAAPTAAAPPLRRPAAPPGGAAAAAAAPAFTPAAQAALVEALTRARTVPAVMHAVAPHRGARFSFFPAVLALARVGGLRASRAPGALQDPRFATLLAELHGALAPESAVPLAARRDPRALASLLHSLSRLRAPLALGPPGEAEGALRARLAALRPPGRVDAALAGAALAEAAAAAALAELPAFPPAPLARAAEALAALGHADPALFLRVAALAGSGVCAAAPAAPRSAGAASGGGSAFSPRDVAALARAYARAGLAEGAAWEALLPAGGGGALPRALPTYGSEAALSISRALCASLAAAKGAAARGGEGAAAAAALVAAQEKRLFALTEELCLRLSLAAAGSRSGGGGDGGGGSSEDAALRGLKTVADPAARLALMAARMGGGAAGEGAPPPPLLRTPERVAELPPRALAALLHAHAVAGSCPPALFGLACEHFIAPPPPPPAEAAREPPPAPGRGGGDSDGEVDVIDGGDWGAGSGAPPPPPPPPPPSRLWLLDAPALANLAWALARTAFEGSATPALWAQIAACADGAVGSALAALPRGDGGGAAPEGGGEGKSAAAAAAEKERRTRAALAALATSVGALPPPPSGGGGGAAAAPPPPSAPAPPPLRPGDLSAIVWSLTAASVPAAPLAARALAHAAAAAPSYSLPALAQLLWGAGVQGALGAPGAAAAAVAVCEYVATAVGAAAAAAAGASGGGGGGGGDADPDAVAEWLLTEAEPPTPALRALARIAKAQLHEGICALRFSGEGGEAAAGAAEAALPPGAAAAWAAAARRSGEAAAAAPPAAALAADVGRVLKLAGVPHEAGAAAWGGRLRCDFFLPLPGGGGGRAVEVQGPASFQRGAGRAAAPALTLAAAARVRWLQGAGLRPVVVTAAEWADNPSTDEKCALLAQKGLPIPESLY